MEGGGATEKNQNHHKEKDPWKDGEIDALTDI